MNQQEQGQELQDDGQRLGHAAPPESYGAYLSGWLQGREQRYGGMHKNVTRRTVSRFDPRTAAEIARGGMTGGDRMTHHGYAQTYAQAIAERYMAAITPELLRQTETRFSGGVELGIRPVNNSPYDKVENPKSVFHGHRMQPKDTNRGRNYAPVYAENLPGSETEMTLVELGILRGVGLAIWCDLFPMARVIGLDVDLSHFRENEPELIRRGAFAQNKPEVYEFDELAPDAKASLANILGERKIDIFIDDALHYDAAILKIMREVMPFMAEGGVYFVEDNWKVHKKIRAKYPKRSVKSVEEMTVVTC